MNNNIPVKIFKRHITGLYTLRRQ